MKDQILKISDDFQKTGSISKTAHNMCLSTGSVRKALITAGTWTNKLVVDIALVRREHPNWDNSKLAEALNISVKTVQAYSPYEGFENMSYNLDNTSVEENDIIDEGECGLHAYWKLSKSGTLSISGAGPMNDYPGLCWGVWGKPRPKWWLRRDGIKVRKIVIEDGITTVGQYAFCDLLELESVNLPESILEIKGGAFVGENHIVKFVIPPKVNYISWDTFYTCTLLEEVHIPNTVDKIQSYAFHGCTSLERIYFYGNAPKVSNSTFDMCHKDRISVYHKKEAEGFEEFWNGMKTRVF